MYRVRTYFKDAAMAVVASSYGLQDILDEPETDSEDEELSADPEQDKSRQDRVGERVEWLLAEDRYVHRVGSNILFLFG